ncbi:MAG: methyltransferase domain-containing protein [Acidimicrobiales bacterium]
MTGTRAPLGLSTADRHTSAWFKEHYEDAATQIVDFLGGDNVTMAGADVADVGCGDGIIDLGVAHQAQPRSLVGFDLQPTDVASLVARSQVEGVGGELPACLSFRTCEPATLPADDASFDFVITWSAFEHIGDPVATLREIKRILRPGGILFLQLWPFYASEHGAHLWDCLADDSYAHLYRSQADIEREVRQRADHPPEVLDELLEVFFTLNKVTIDDLQRAMVAAALRPSKVTILTETVHIPPELARRSLSQLGISGVKILAVHA